MNNEELGKKIARELFKIGDDPDDPCMRIAFMCGQYGMNEHPAGGLCETALAGCLATILDNVMDSDGGGK